MAVAFHPPKLAYLPNSCHATKDLTAINDGFRPCITLLSSLSLQLTVEVSRQTQYLFFTWRPTTSLARGNSHFFGSDSSCATGGVMLLWWWSWWRPAGASWSEHLTRWSEARVWINIFSLEVAGYRCFLVSDLPAILDHIAIYSFSILNQVIPSRCTLSLRSGFLTTKDVDKFLRIMFTPTLHILLLFCDTFFYSNPFVSFLWNENKR